MVFINIGPVYVRGWAGGMQGWGWVVAKAKTKKQDDTSVEFRVAMTFTYTHTQRANIPPQGLDRHVQTVGAISGPHRQIGALH